MSNQQELRKHRCCFTGHRPERIKQSESEITVLLEAAIRAAIGDGFVTFISGVARGVDLWAAEIVLRLRDEGEPIHLICASPYAGFEENWSADWQRRYIHVLQNADIVRYISPSYNRECFQRRNEWMVDRSARLIAVYNGGPSGTRNTIRYAQKQHIQIVDVLEK